MINYNNELEQGSDEWLEVRSSRITASMVGAVLGNNPYSKPEDAMRDLVRSYFGAEREFTGNKATEYGNEHEEVALQDYMIDTGNEVDSSGFVTNDKYKGMGFSPDGLISDNGGLEIKCPFSKKLFKLKDKPYYEDQVCFSLLLSEREYWDFYVWTPTEQSLETVAISDARAWWERNEISILEFIDGFNEIIADEKLYKKHLDPKKMDMSEDKTFIDLAEHRKQLKDLMAGYEKELKEIESELKEIAETKGSDLTGCGINVTKVVRKGSINYAKIPELKSVNLEDYRKDSTTYFSIK